MFLKEMIHTIKAQGVNRRQIWKVWEDVNQWHTWDRDIDWAKLDEPFVSGSRFTLKPKAGPVVNIQIFDVVPEKGFIDMCRFPLAKMYSVHQMSDVEGGVEIMHAIRVEGMLGWLWWKLVAKKVAEGMPAQTVSMLAKARTMHE
jgi:hypothetical protein